MIIDSIEIPDLSKGSEAAFLNFESRLREALTVAQRRDRDEESDQNGVYVGNYLPQRYYVSSILAFLDEFGLEIDVADISDLPANEFYGHFSQFYTKINYARTRMALRSQRFEQDVAGTPLVILADAKAQISELIGTIRKIVNQEISDDRKRDAIFRKLRALQEEVDRDRHTYDSVFKLLVDLSKSVGDAAENLDPLIEKLERLKKLFFEKTEREKTLPNSKRKKQLPKPEDNVFGLDDEIPF